MKFIRHGDVLIIPASKLEKTNPEKKDRVLMEGEVTGHAHRLSAGTVWRNPKPNEANLYALGEMLIPLEGALTHEEHHTIKLKKGKYKFYGQREYDPVQEHMVRD